MTQYCLNIELRILNFLIVFRHNFIKQKTKRINERFKNYFPFSAGDEEIFICKSYFLTYVNYNSRLVFLFISSAFGWKFVCTENFRHVMHKLNNHGTSQSQKEKGEKYVNNLSY